MEKAVCIVGPTAVGKTNLAIRIAKQFRGSIVSADSVQVFKNLDIISGKDKNELQDVDVYLIDVVSPDTSFSVSQFENKGKEALRKIADFKRLPIVVGGTGLYVKSLIDGIETSLIRPDLRLRLELQTKSLTELQEILLKLDPQTFNEMNESDRKNKRRIIRKIEIIKNGKLKIENGKVQQGVGFLQIGLELSREELRKRIDSRVDKRIQEGAVEEARSLFENYDSLAPQVKDANGYKQLFEYFLGRLTLEEAIEKWKISEYKHAKNQMTWFKKDKRIKWFEADGDNLFDVVKKAIDMFITD